MILSRHNDPMGCAIRDYFEHHHAHRLRVLSPMFEEDEMPVGQLFRLRPEMSPIEQRALSLCRGRVLDVGAGAGCHSLALTAEGFDVTAIDISPLSVEVMRKRGVKRAEPADFFSSDLDAPFDTLLMLMNGLGIAGRIDRLGAFFRRADELLAEGGQILADSTDLRYIFEDEEGQFFPDPEEDYYGEVEYQMAYGKVTGPAFHWLYIDFETLARHAARHGFAAETVLRGTNYDYLARLTRRPSL